jgi:OOP family OmpA-OmpF porin
MTPGYQTSSPSFYHIDLGTRYTINPYIGIKGILATINSQIKVTQEFNSNYIRVNLQAVADVGYALNLYNRRTDRDIISCRSFLNLTTIQTL